MAVSWQPSLFSSAATPGVDDTFASMERIALDGRSWVDHAPEWVTGGDALLEELVRSAPWAQRTRHMFDRVVDEPRLTARWVEESGEALVPEVLDRMRAALSDRYGVVFDSAGFNMYRDGRDSVAWHGDRIAREIEEPVVALVSLGAPRAFLLRPKGGGRSRRFMLGRGDLLVTGGRCQREWQHSVPKVASAGLRVSIAFRHGHYRAAE